MPNPRVPDSVKKRRGTYRADRAENSATDPDNDALAEYKALAKDAYARAIKGHDATRDIAYLRQCEDVLFAHGVTLENGRKWDMGTLAELARG